MPNARSVAIAATPIVAIVIVALGLRLGAGDDVLAAVVRAAPPAESAAGLAWQIETSTESHGTLSPVAVPSLEVVARSGGHTTTWKGASNEEGIAEAWLALPGVKAHDPVELDVRDDATGKHLASGYAHWQDVGDPVSSAPAWAKYARRVGAIALDVAVYGAKLASETPGVLWVRATDATTGAPVADATIAASGEGLSFEHPTSKTDARGWARLDVEPLGLVYDLVLHATTESARSGEWAGALASAPGGCGVSLPWRVVPNVQQTFEIVAPSKRDLAYVEIDDDTGRVSAEIRTFRTDAMHRVHASFDVPRLAAGFYRLVVAGDSRGGETLSPSAMQWPFLVAGTDAEAVALPQAPAACRVAADAPDLDRVVGWCLAMEAPHAIAKWPTLDGFPLEHGVAAQRRLQGFLVAVGSLAVAAVLETLLILGAVGAERRRMRASADLDATRQRGTAARVAVGLLVALLGFALIAMLVLRGG
jgi:hypothetical protein